jgi:predicted DNA-binding transcriptional regulator AlpA
MASRQATRKTPDDTTTPIKREPTPPQPPPREALSIPEFCVAFGISEDFFYKLKRKGQAPRLMKVGTRTTISMEAATKWRREREDEHEAGAAMKNAAAAKVEA